MWIQQRVFFLGAVLVCVHCAGIFPLRRLARDVECPNRWEREGDACYYISETKMNWQNARDFCKKQPGGDLASLHSEEEQNVIIKKMHRIMWIGLNSIEEEGKWKWSDGSPTDYLRWRENEPNLLNEERCTELIQEYVDHERDRGTFNNVLCKWTLPFGCKLKRKGTCMRNWNSFGDFCYHFPNHEAPWREAEDYCQTLDSEAHLISLNSELEMYFVAARLRWFGWIGLHSLDEHNVWKWSDGTQTDYIRWEPNEPNHLDDQREKCVELRRLTRAVEGNWNNINCNDRKHFTCKSILAATRTTPPVPPPSSSCPPIELPSGMAASCHNGDTLQVLNCISHLPPGSVVQYRCKTFYKSVTNLPAGLARCSNTGEWLPPRNFHCTAICGRTSVAKDSVSFIQHGRSSSRGAWPWHAALYLNDEFRCGASLISERSLLTAAHCVVSPNGSKFPASSIKIGLGKLYKGIDESDESVQIHEISAIEAHPDYDSVLRDADIAIIVLRTTATITAFVRPVCYPTSSTSFEVVTQLEEGTLGVVSGWGNTENGSLSADKELQTAELPYVSPRRCYETSRNRPPPRSNTFCAGFRNGTNVCNGDSGGGMAFPIGSGTDRRYILQGIVSSGIQDRNTGQCIAEEYSTFTRVSSFVDNWLINALLRLEHLGL